MLTAAMKTSTAISSTFAFAAARRAMSPSVFTISQVAPSSA